MSPFFVIFSQSDLILRIHNLFVFLRFWSWLKKREFQILFKEEILFWNIKSSMFTESLGYTTATIIIPITKFSNLTAYQKVHLSIYWKVHVLRLVFWDSRSFLRLLLSNGFTWMFLLQGCERQFKYFKSLKRKTSRPFFLKLCYSWD